MVAFSWDQSLRSQNGNGIIDTMLKPFTVNKYGDERHMRSLDPNHFLTGYSYVGPHTEIMLRSQLHDDVPLNKLDEAAKEHDLSYLHEKEAYEKDHDKPLHMKHIWNEDSKFIAKARAQRDDPIGGIAAANLISAKRKLEQTGVLDSKEMSGFGYKEDDESSDPAFKLRQLVKSKYKKELKRDHKLIKHERDQSGGFAFAPVLIPIVASVLATLSGKVYDTIRDRIKGKGYDLPHLKNKEEKHEYVLKLLKHI